MTRPLGSVRRSRTRSRPQDQETALQDQETAQDRARRKELLVERSVKQYVDKFLDDDERSDAATGDSLAQSTVERLGALEETLASKLAALAEKVDGLELVLRGGRTVERAETRQSAAPSQAADPSVRPSPQGVEFDIGE